MKLCREKIVKHELDMKLIDCEYAFDGTKIVFYFTSAGRVDFRELVKDLASTFKTRIELRQVGTRDETKYLGGLAPCGRVCCCAGNMPEFKKVSIKMAKTQGLSLNPGKISGLCGRLMCCLSYENDYYADVYKKMPKVGSEVGTPDGRGVVASVNMLKLEVKVKIEDSNGGLTFKDFPVDEVKFKKNVQAEIEKDDETEEE
jgi:cell fate regulator YaaT (PSP1 superfamily)